VLYACWEFVRNIGGRCSGSPAAGETSVAAVELAGPYLFFRRVMACAASFSTSGGSFVHAGQTARTPACCSSGQTRRESEA
jgi:hypothetical protein